MRLVLYQPEIPPNTGNVIRLATNVGAPLDLIHPLGFTLDNARLRRAGLDYAELAIIQEWSSFEAWHEAHAERRLFATTKHGDTRYDRPAYREADALIFGAETYGLPQAIKDRADARLYIPMRTGNRSLNLGNSAAVVAYEAWRQRCFQ